MDVVVVAALAAGAMAATPAAASAAVPASASAGRARRLSRDLYHFMNKPPLALGFRDVTLSISRPVSFQNTFRARRSWHGDSLTKSLVKPHAHADSRDKTIPIP